jgi:protein-disulfide isomerase
MKNGQLILGLLIGTALGAFISNMGSAELIPASGKAQMHDRAAIAQIVRETMASEGKLIMDAVNKYQAEERAQRTAGATKLLKDPEIRDAIENDPEVAFAGPEDSTRVVTEFFDYNCPACKMQYKALAEVMKKDKGIKVVFHEYPIFGAQSDTNSKIGLGVWNVAPKKYLAFHEKMMSTEGRTNEEQAYRIVKDIGVNVAKVKAYVASQEAQEALQKSKSLGQKLGIQGTPSLVIGEELIPHAAPASDILSKLGANEG